jgi:2-phosphosulfolactate phosphatase
MKPILNVYALPKLVEPAELAGAAAVVIDVLRASTTILYALDAGATTVVPCLEIADARALAKQYPTGDVRLGGERHGVAIEGFDLGNSPEEYTAERVGGRTVVLTTTNGTRAMIHAREAKDVLIGAFVNASAIVTRLLAEPKVCILCAGTDGQISEDDTLVAGLLVDQLHRRGGMECEQNAQATVAREQWLRAFARPQAIGGEPLSAERLAERLRPTLGARNLIALGLDDDILAAAQIDRFDIVPRFDARTYQIKC